MTTSTQTTVPVSWISKKPGVCGGEACIQSTRIPVTVSLGVVGFHKGESPTELYARADALLHRSKQGGRNRVST